jgi:uncharacterized protein YndB with AHSA1/START domain
VQKKKRTSSADGEFVLATSRTLDYPRPLVFKAWTTPEYLIHWWGPKGFTNTFNECHPKPGGRWRFTMHGPNGADYPNEMVFTKLRSPDRILLTHLTSPHFALDVTLEAKGTQTHVTWRQIFETSADLERVRLIAVEANEQNLDRLEAQLAWMV